MTEEEIAVKLEGHEHELKSLKHRMIKQEDNSNIIQGLLLQVKELAVTMQQMLEEQREQGKRLDRLEEEPADSWRQLKRMVLTAAVSGLAGAVVGALSSVL